MLGSVDRGVIKVGVSDRIKWDLHLEANPTGVNKPHQTPSVNRIICNEIQRHFARVGVDVSWQRRGGGNSSPRTY
jgi:hypothetical protein